MKIIIVGGGKLGKDIADNMLERKYHALSHRRPVIDVIENIRSLRLSTHFVTLTPFHTHLH